MTNPINVELKDLGIINGMITTQVINADTGEVIGYNQTAAEEEE
jgi:hypothetical protein